MLSELRAKVHISCENGVNVSIVIVKLNKSILSYKISGNKFLIDKLIAVLEDVA